MRWESCRARSGNSLGSSHTARAAVPVPATPEMPYRTASIPAGWRRRQTFGGWRMGWGDCARRPPEEPEEAMVAAFRRCMPLSPDRCVHLLRPTMPNPPRYVAASLPSAARRGNGLPRVMRSQGGARAHPTGLGSVRSCEGGRTTVPGAGVIGSSELRSIRRVRQCPRT